MSTQKRKTDNEFVGTFVRASGETVMVPLGKAADMTRDNAAHLIGLLTVLSSSDISTELKRSLRLAAMLASDIHELIDIVEDDAMIGGVKTPAVTVAPSAPKLVSSSS